MKTLTIIVAMLALPGAAHAQEGAPAMKLADYLRNVQAGNPDLKAARASIDIARAQIDIAKVLPDPEISLGVSQYDITRRGNPTMIGGQLSVPIELGGKRRSRVAVAKAGVDGATLDYADAVRSLRGLATDTFINALHARLMLTQKQEALASLQRLVDVNQRRLAAGDIAETELVQSRVEMRRFAADVLDAEGEQRASEVALGKLVGGEGPARIVAEGELRVSPPHFDRPGLAAGLDQRSDVRAAAMRLETARRQVELEHAKRMIDVSVGVGWTRSLAVGGEAGSPAADLVAASVSVPLPFSRIYRGELAAAEATQRQSQNQLEAVRVRARAELQEALALFDAAARRVALYDDGTLVDASAVLSKTLYSYQRGEATLVELLIAQRTASEVQLAYLDALADRAHALVAVGQAAGLQDQLLGL
jgi:outer membrane protein, heavy metal efflux system